MGKPLHSVRLPPPSADAFVALDGAPGSTPVAGQPASPPAVKLVSRRKTVARADGRVLRKQTVYLEAELARRLAVYCAANGMDISEAVARAVDKLMEG